MEKTLIELLNQINKLILKFKNNFRMCSGGATATPAPPLATLLIPLMNLGRIQRYY